MVSAGAPTKEIAILLVLSIASIGRSDPAKGRDNNDNSSNASTKIEIPLSIGLKIRYGGSNERDWNIVVVAIP